jgi:ZIP family zinc transporter
MTLLNGLAEPIGVVIGGFLLKDNMGPEVLSASLALVAGIMACISLHELFPTSIEYAGKARASVALFVGMFCTFGALEIVHSIMHDHGGHSHGHDHSGHDHSGHHHSGHHH